MRKRLSSTNNTFFHRQRWAATCIAFLALGSIALLQGILQNRAAQSSSSSTDDVTPVRHLGETEHKTSTTTTTTKSKPKPNTQHEKSSDSSSNRSSSNNNNNNKKNNSNRPAGVGTPIPPIIHLIHVSRGLPPQQGPTPQSIQDSIKAWKDIHPNWDVRLWDNAAVRTEFSPADQALLQRMNPVAWLSDIVRYKVLEKYGGFVFDTAIVPIQSIHPLRTAGPVWGVCQSPSIPNVPQRQAQLPMSSLVEPRCDMMSGDVLAAVPHHAALTTALDRALVNSRDALRKREPWTIHLSGAPMFQTIANTMRNAVKALKSFTFFPCPDAQQQGNNCIPDKFRNSNPNVYGMYMWRHSWIVDGNDSGSSANKE